jgi:hypothetical protein
MRQVIKKATAPTVTENKTLQIKLYPTHSDTSKENLSSDDEGWFARRIGKLLFGAGFDVKTLERAKEDGFEEDPLPLLLLEWMGSDTQKGPIDISRLHSELQAKAQSLNWDFNYKSNVALGKRLSNIRSILETQLGIQMTQTTGHSNVTMRTFVRKCPPKQGGCGSDG